MKKAISLILVAACALNAMAGQPLERFRGADRVSFSFGDNAPRYGNVDANIRVEVDAFLLGNQVFDATGGTDEFESAKTAGSLNLELDLSKINPLFPPETITLTGSDLGGDRTRHVTDQVLPGPYRVAGSLEGVDFDLTLRNVRVQINVESQFSNNVTDPTFNPILNAECDVQFDDVNGGAGNTIAVVPGDIEGWIVSPLFTVNSARIDVTNIQQAGQVPTRFIDAKSIRVVLGRIDRGNIASLVATDGDFLRVCKFIVPNQTVDPVNVEVIGQGPSTGSAFLSVTENARMATTGAFRRVLELFNYQTNSWDTTDLRTDVANTTLTRRRLDATGNLERYYNPANDELRLRYRIRQTGPAGSSLWCHEADELRWITTP